MTLLLIVLTIAMNFGKTGLVNSAEFLFTFMPDIDEVVTAKRREGSYSGVNSFLDVLFSTLETVVIGVLLQVSGFVKNAKVQPVHTTDALLILYTIVPIILVAIGIVASYRFNFNKESHAILISEVERLKNGGSKLDVTNQARTVIESLIGFTYEQCWGNNNLVEHEPKIVDNSFETVQG